ncbi:MAG: hypothetical protein QM677_02560 [Microbacterium sp.]
MTPGSGGLKPIDLGPTGERVAEGVAHFRNARRLSYQALSDLLSDAGWPIPILGLRRIESRARRVTVDDLMALAFVLEVPPLDLLMPPPLSDGPMPTGAPDGLVPAEVRAWARENTGLSPRALVSYWDERYDELMRDFEMLIGLVERASTPALRRKHFEDELTQVRRELAIAKGRLEQLRTDG